MLAPGWANWQRELSSRLQVKSFKAKKKDAKEEKKRHAGCSSQVVGYQAKTKGSNRSAKTKLSSRAEKSRKDVRNKSKRVEKWNKASKNLWIAPRSKEAYGKKSAYKKQ